MKILITGASGQLGAYLLQELAGSVHPVTAWSGSRVGSQAGFDLIPVDLADLDAIEPALDRADPGVVIHAAALSSAEAVRRDRPHAEAINVRATRRIAEWVESRRRRLIFTSTDLVFAGHRAMNREDDPAEPVLAYGQTKRAAERVLTDYPTAVVVRLPLLFGRSRCGRPSFFDGALAALSRGEPQSFFEDEYRTPLDYHSAARGLIQLALSDVAGLIHLAGAERISRFELMARTGVALGIDPTLIRANRQAEANFPEPRPADVSLDTTRWRTRFPAEPWPSVAAALQLGESG